MNCVNCGAEVGENTIRCDDCQKDWEELSA